VTLRNLANRRQIFTFLGHRALNHRANPSTESRDTCGSPNDDDSGESGERRCSRKWSKRKPTQRDLSRRCRERVRRRIVSLWRLRRRLRYLFLARTRSRSFSFFSLTLAIDISSLISRSPSFPLSYATFPSQSLLTSHHVPTHILSFPFCFCHSVISLFPFVHFGTVRGVGAPILIPTEKFIAPFQYVLAQDDDIGNLYYEFWWRYSAPSYFNTANISGYENNCLARIVPTKRCSPHQYTVINAYLHNGDIRYSKGMTRKIPP